MRGGQKKLSERLLDLGLTQEQLDNFVQADSVSAQRGAAPWLRAMAIEHLRSGSGPVAETFRQEYSAATRQSYEDFLAAQSKNGAWGTYILAAALGELLDAHIVVTDSKATYALYRAEDDNAPVIHLTNLNNQHWFVDSQTLGDDGNCLFNAIARRLQIELSSPAELARIQQTKLFNQHVKHHPTPAALAESIKAENARIAALPEAERKQIMHDHQLALELALHGAVKKSRQSHPQHHAKTADLSPAVQTIQCKA